MAEHIGELSIRMREIFGHVVEAYLERGIPVGSKALTGTVNLSPASIRGVMQDLEERGLLTHPHTSAGRIPTETGLRLFVDGIMQVAAPDPWERREIERQIARDQPIEDALAAASAALSGLSQAAGVVLAPKSEIRLKQLGLVPLGPDRALAVLVGAELVEARSECLALLRAPFAEAAGALGLPAAMLGYEGELPTVEALEARLDRDLERGSTGLGPHLHDVSVSSDGRDLRSFGSQGEQRTAVLALLLAEATLLTERRDEPPLLLLDDVLSELDPTRRRVLVEQVEGRGQTLITATTADALPGEPAQLLHVTPGEVTWSG